jgi:hypothetical protein
VARGAAVGLPTWVVLLAALPATGLGVVACLALATLVAVVAVVLAERLRPREQEPPAGGGRRPRRAMSPLAAAALTLAAVGLVVYVIFVVRAA